MKPCQPHWDKLREAIRTRGLWPLVARNGTEAGERIVEEVEGTATDATYDPLMNCYWMISTRALERGGLYMLTGDLCPVCEAIKYSRIGDGPDEFRDATHVEHHWIDGPADAALQYVRERPELAALLASLSALGQPKEGE